MASYRGAGYCLLPPSRHPDGPGVSLADSAARWPDAPNCRRSRGWPLPCYTEHTEDADNTAIVCSVDSVCSVSLCVTSDETPHDRVEKNDPRMSADRTG